MATSKPVGKSWLVVIAMGLLIGLLATLVAMSVKPSAFDPLEEIDTTEPKMVRIPAGQFEMGNDAGEIDERPAHTVSIRGFLMDETEVTNGQFAAFIKSTGYVTVAEQQPDPKKYPGADPQLLRPGSAVFNPVAASTDSRTWTTAFPPWWEYRIGANWKQPEGPGSNLKGKMNHPVVQIAWTDAAAYAKWAGKRLPSEAEWEYAARGGLPKNEFTWGTCQQGQDAKWYANTFQGQFPNADSGADGFIGLAPVRSYAPNAFGLFDMSGNVWEWCEDWYDSTYYARSPKENPKGPETGELDRQADQPQRVRRGGSFLCTDSYCRRYVPNARDKNPEDSGASHSGFRCVKDE